MSDPAEIARGPTWDAGAAAQKRLIELGATLPIPARIHLRQAFYDFARTILEQANHDY